MSPRIRKVSAYECLYFAWLRMASSAAWPEVEQGSGQETITRLAEFYCLLKQESTSLGHITVDTVTVVNHLRHEMPVPLVFCNSWPVRTL